MEDETFNQEEVRVEQKSQLHQVTPLSKYLAMALFIILPFVGGYIGYALAPEKIIEVPVEVERVVVEERVTENTVLESDRGRRVFIKGDIPTGWQVYSRQEGELEYGIGKVRYQNESDALLLSHRTLIIRSGPLEEPYISVRKNSNLVLSHDDYVDFYTGQKRHETDGAELVIEEMLLGGREVTKITRAIQSICDEVTYVYGFLDDLSIAVQTSTCSEDLLQVAEDLEFFLR